MPAASFSAARKLLHRKTSVSRRLRGWLGLLLSVVLVAGMGVVAVVAAPAAAADPTGTGGQFVPLQARLVDTRTGTGGFTGPMPAGTFETFVVSGQAGLPSTGVAAIVASVTAINGTGSTGTVTTGANSGGSAGTVTALQFGGNDTVSNTVVIENGDDGKIKISASQSVQILLDIQGYFTAGNGNPAPGGFVPLPAGNVATIASSETLRLLFTVGK